MSIIYTQIRCLSSRFFIFYSKNLFFLPNFPEAAKMSNSVVSILDYEDNKINLLVNLCVFIIDDSVFIVDN